MTEQRRRFWLWVNVVCLGIALAGILVGLTLGSRPVVQAILMSLSVLVLVFGVGSAVVVAVKVRRENAQENRQSRGPQ